MNKCQFCNCTVNNPVDSFMFTLKNGVQVHHYLNDLIVCVLCASGLMESSSLPSHFQEFPSKLFGIYYEMSGTDIVATHFPVSESSLLGVRHKHDQ